MSLTKIIAKYQNFIDFQYNSKYKIVEYNNRSPEVIYKVASFIIQNKGCYGLRQDYDGVLLVDKDGEIKGMYFFNEVIVKGVKILHLELSCLSNDIRGGGMSSYLRNIAFDYALQNGFEYITSDTVGPEAYKILENKIGFDCKGEQGRALIERLGIDYPVKCILDLENKREQLTRIISDFFDADLILDRKVRKANATNYADSDLSWIVNDEFYKRYQGKEWIEKLFDFLEESGHTQKGRNELLVSLPKYLSPESSLSEREKEMVQIAIRILRGSREYVLLAGGSKRRLRKSRKYKNKRSKSCRRRRKSRR